MLGCVEALKRARASCVRLFEQRLGVVEYGADVLVEGVVLKAVFVVKVEVFLAFEG